MRKTTEFKMDALRQAIEVKAARLNLNIFEMRTPNRTDPLRFGVNWGAHGTQSPEEALDYADAIKQAATVASMVNRLELDKLTIDREDPIEWRQLSQEEYKKLFGETVKYLMYMFDHELDHNLVDYFDKQEA